MTPAARFAKAIRDKREAKGITAAAAADAAGLSLSRWYDIEAGRLDSPPVLDTIQSIASAVGADVVELATLALELVKQR